MDIVNQFIKIDLCYNKEFRFKGLGSFLEQSNFSRSGLSSSIPLKVRAGANYSEQ